MSTEDVTAEIAAVLAEHEYALGMKRGSICICGHVPTVDPSTLWPQQDYHRHHLAGLLAARDRRVRGVLAEYFDFDVDPWDDHDAACPAPEDIWRLHRDLKAAIEGEADA